MTADFFDLDFIVAGSPCKSSCQATTTRRRRMADPLLPSSAISCLPGARPPNRSVACNCSQSGPLPVPNPQFTTCPSILNLTCMPETIADAFTCNAQRGDSSGNSSSSVTMSIQSPRFSEMLPTSSSFFDTISDIFLVISRQARKRVSFNRQVSRSQSTGFRRADVITCGRGARSGRPRRRFAILERATRASMRKHAMSLNMVYIAASVFHAATRAGTVVKPGSRHEFQDHRIRERSRYLRAMLT